MSFFDALILGILQGITEFLPISSSGHLVIVEHFLGLQVEILKSFDVIVHMGTLLAILLYFKKDVWGLFVAFLKLFKADFKDPYAKMILFILVGTIPAVFAGLFLEERIDAFFRNKQAVAFSMMILAFVYLIAEFAHKRKLKDMVLEKVDDVKDVLYPGEYLPPEIRGLKWYKAVLIGFAQAVALIPGISRSGSTIAAGLFMGIKRDAAARFSFLLGIPAILGAGVLTFFKLFDGSGGAQFELMPLLTGFVASFVFGYISVYFLMNFLKRHTLIVFSIYLLAIGMALIV